MENLEKICPDCGAALPQEASFCPYCARSLNTRAEVTMPKRISRKQLRIGAVVLVIAALVLTVYLLTRPKVYDNGTAEALYTNENGTYQICIAWANEPFTPTDHRYSTGELNYAYRYPTLLYVNHVENDTHAGQTFMQNVDHVTAEFIDPDPALHISCTSPVPRTDYIPDAACITFVDFNISEPGDYVALLVVTLHMKNGDIIRVRQEQHFHTINTYHYTPDDAPMDTVADLQALLETIDRTAEPDDVVNIYLPAVTYDDEILMIGQDRFLYFYGSTDGDVRTTFTKSLQISNNESMCFLDGIDFVGDGVSVGVSDSGGRVHLTNCRVTGWKTGVMAYGNAWVNTDDCVFEDNAVGLLFNCVGNNVSDTYFEDNTFQNNGTALLLEQIESGIIMKFPGTVFSDNDADIDNRCSQTLDLNDTMFQ